MLSAIPVANGATPATKASALADESHEFRNTTSSGSSAALIALAHARFRHDGTAMRNIDLVFKEDQALVAVRRKMNRIGSLASFSPP